ncbi:MAG: hypothetical protein NUV84_02630 [Candidatus Uhrbacteria bacterium]|nr:hypothetical protein [Candidatus Uhrbacteria bacterium]
MSLFRRSEQPTIPPESPGITKLPPVDRGRSARFETGEVRVDVKGQSVDITPKLDNGETLATEDLLRDMAREVIGMGETSDKTVAGRAYQLPYDQTPPELKLFQIAPERTNPAPLKGESSTYENAYSLMPHEISRRMPNTHADLPEYRGENIYVKVGGYVRLKRRVEFGKDGIASIMDVRHDEDGFPIESAKRIGQTIHERRLNSFSPDGRLVKQIVVKYDQQGKEIETQTDEYSYSNRGSIIGVEKKRMKQNRVGGQYETKIEPSVDSTYQKTTGLASGGGVGSLYAY